MLVYLIAKNSRRWYLDSGYSRYMCGDKNQFITIEPKEEGGVVTFGDNGQGKIVGIGKIQINSTTFIDNVLYVKSLKHYLISIRQLCDKGYTVSIGTIMRVTTNPKDNVTP